MSIRVTLVLCILLALLGWVALGYFTYNNPPTGWNLWIALAMLWPTLVATFLPVLFVIHWKQANGTEIALPAIRRSALAATFLTLCVWLRMIRALNWANTLLMFLLFLATEVLLSTRGNP